MGSDVIQCLTLDPLFIPVQGQNAHLQQSIGVWRGSHLGQIDSQSQG